MKKIYELSKSFLLFRAFSILQDFGYKYTVELENEEAQKAKTTKDPPMKPILIVDDEAPIRALIRLTLERAGYTCDEAATGTEAADKIEANTYDLALLDIMLPGPDGYELLDYLRVLKQEGFIRLDRRKGAVIALDVDKAEALLKMRENLRILLAKGCCKNVTRGEVHALVDDIFDEYGKE